MTSVAVQHSRDSLGGRDVVVRLEGPSNLLLLFGVRGVVDGVQQLGELGRRVSGDVSAAHPSNGVTDTIGLDAKPFDTSTAAHAATVD